jgi:5-methylcytosine-specific restriction endonuclease McrA
VYCGFDGTSLPNWGQLQIDHLIPTKSGGPNEPRNKVVGCSDCNRLKHAFDPSSRNPSLLDNEEGRETLIKAAAAHIARGRSAELGDFLLMMEDIRQKYGN